MTDLRALLPRLLVAALGSAVFCLAFAVPVLASPPEAPEVSAPSPLFATAATLRGTLNPHAVAAAEGTYRFLYNKTAEGKGCDGGEQAGESSSQGVPAETVSGEAMALSPSTEYAVCLQLTNSEGELATSGPLTFKTPASVPPEAPETTVESVNINEATLAGVLSPKGAEPAEGTYRFLYRAGASCEGGGETTGGIALGGAPEPLPAEVINGLLPGTEYTACLSTTNLSNETTLSSPVTFTTLPAAAPIVESQSAEAKHETASVSATINPGGVAATCEVRYGPTPALGSSAPCPTGIAAGDTGQTATVELARLQPKTEYHFEFLATNNVGTGSPSEQATFKTGPYPPPIVRTSEASEVKRANAVLNGKVLPSEAEPTTYYYEYGTEPCQAGSCGTKTTEKGPVTGFAQKEATTEKLMRLKPGTTYHYWFVASGPGGTAHGEPAEFTTATAEPEEYTAAGHLEIGASEKSTPAGVAVNQTTGDIYVGVEDGASNYIEQFDSEGVPQSTTEVPTVVYQLAVDNACYEHVPQLTGRACTAFDPSVGDVYAALPNENIVDKFARVGAGDPSDEGKLAPTAGELGKGELNEPRGVAVDASGDIYVASYTSGTVSKFAPDGSSLDPKLVSGISHPFGLAIGVDGGIYVATESGTVQYTLSGACAEPQEESCKRISEGVDLGIALDSAGDIFVSDLAGHRVNEYAAAAGHPSLQNLALGGTSAFPADIYGVAVNQKLKRLYVSESANANRSGTVKVFRLLQAEPVIVKTEPATRLSGATDALQGTVNPGGQEPAEYWFEYSTAPCDAESCGTSVREQGASPLNGDEPIPVSVRLEGLAPNTTYHYRLVGANEESGVEYGEEQSFTTGSETKSRPSKNETETRIPGPSKAPAAAEYPNLSTLAPVPGPKETTVVGHPVTRAERLSKALNACHKDKRRTRRLSCERLARAAYGPKHKPKPKK